MWSSSLVIALACEPKSSPESEQGEAASTPASDDATKRCYVPGLNNADGALASAPSTAVALAAGVGVYEACKLALPPTYTRFFESIKKGEADKDVLGQADEQRQALEEKVCPGAFEAFKKIGESPMAQRRRLLWDLCKLGEAGLVESPAQLSPHATLMPYAMHAMMRDHGLEPEPAARLGRALVHLEREALRPFAVAAGQQLPKSTRADPVAGALPQVELNLQGTTVWGRGWAYPEAAPAGGDVAGAAPRTRIVPDPTLANTLEALPKGYAGERAGDDPAQAAAVLFIADARLPAWRLASAVSTAKAAGFESAWLAVETPDGHGMLPLAAPPDPEAEDGRSVELTLRAEGMQLTARDPQSGDGALDEPTFDRSYPPTDSALELSDLSRWPTAPVSADLDALDQQLQSLERGQVTVAPELTVEALALGLELMRGPQCKSRSDTKCRFANTRLALSERGAAPAGGMASTSVPGEAPAKIPAGGGEVVAGATVVMGSMSKDIIRRVVRTHMPEIRSCYETRLQLNPKLAGKVTLSFVIGTQGTVQSVKVQSSTLPDEVVGQCLTKAVKRWKFPRPDGGIVKVNYPFVFRAN